MCITSNLSRLHFICCFTAVTEYGNIFPRFIVVSLCFYYLEKLGVSSKFCLLVHTPFFSTNENVEQPRYMWLCWWPPSSLKSNLLFLPSVSWLTWRLEFCLYFSALSLPLFVILLLKSHPHHHIEFYTAVQMPSTTKTTAEIDNYWTEGGLALLTQRYITNITFKCK